jgi:hypothetical protein
MAFAQPLDVPDVLAQDGAHLLLRKTEIGSPATVPAQDAVALMRCQSMWPAGSFSTHYF